MYGLPAEVLTPDEVDGEGRRLPRAWELSETPGTPHYPPAARSIALSREVAGQAVGQIMMALLPCIDPNDESKTRAALKFYLHTLASITVLPGDDIPAIGSVDTGAFFISVVSTPLSPHQPSSSKNQLPFVRSFAVVTHFSKQRVIVSLFREDTFGFLISQAPRTAPRACPLWRWTRRLGWRSCWAVCSYCSRRWTVEGPRAPRTSPRYDDDTLRACKKEF